MWLFGYTKCRVNSGPAFFVLERFEMADNNKDKIQPPEIGPFVFPTLLALFGLWCFYDGWLNPNPEMAKHLLLNRIGSIILLPWAVIDFIRTRKRNKPDRAAPADAPGRTGNPER